MNKKLWHFWNECRLRRKEQLSLLEQSLSMLSSASWNMRMELTQERWVEEARTKLAHAERMTEFFERQENHGE